MINFPIKIFSEVNGKGKQVFNLLEYSEKAIIHC